LNIRPSRLGAAATIAQLAFALFPAAPAAAPPRVPHAEAYRYIGKEATVCGRVADATWMERIRGRPTFLILGASDPGRPRASSNAAW
jgi:hypothetical protein